MSMKRGGVRALGPGCRAAWRDKCLDASLWSDVHVPSGTTVVPLEYPIGAWMPRCGQMPPCTLLPYIWISPEPLSSRTQKGLRCHGESGIPRGHLGTIHIFLTRKEHEGSCLVHVHLSSKQIWHCLRTLEKWLSNLTPLKVQDRSWS